MSAEALVPRRRRQPGRLRTFGTTVHAVLTKELRWRMRGRRAFLIATLFVLLLGLLVFGVHQALYDQAVADARWRFAFQFEDDGFMDVPLDQTVSGRVAVRIGQVIFTGILTVLTLLILMVAPALASGAISSERERQTMELLVTTPISTLGMVVGKLIASLAYVVLLIVASVPLMSIVFAFGGVGPADVLRAYLMVLAIAFGFGAIGLYLSALIGRTQVATVVSYIVVLLLVVGTFALHTWIYVSSARDDAQNGVRIRPQAPEFLLLLNPLVADVDVVCTALPEVGGPCDYIGLVAGRPLDDDPAPPPHDAFWPRAALAFVVLGGVLVLLTTQQVSPSRRYRARRGTGLAPPAAAAEVGAEPG